MVLSSKYLLKQWMTMFEDTVVSTSGILANFKDLIRDEFGHSIVVHVHEPLLEEVRALQLLEEYFVHRVAEIDHITEELRAIGDTVHG